jgi:SAM-dependent methyltransferase
LAVHTEVSSPKLYRHTPIERARAGGSLPSAELAENEEMPTLEENRFWDRYDWPQDGDEWTDQAAYCGMNYFAWKQDVVGAFISPNIPDNATVLELAIGHGRWTPFLAQRSRRYIGVDFGPSCVKFCLARFANLTNNEFCNNDGRIIPMVTSSSPHFIWSFDSFVHIEPDITTGYLEEFARVLLPGRRLRDSPSRHPQLLATPARRSISLDTTPFCASGARLRSNSALPG